MHKTKTPGWQNYIALLLLLVYFAQGMAHIRATSITFDEGPHLAVGYATLRTGDFRIQPVHIHPPLANMLAAAPLLLQDDLPDPQAIPGWEIASLSALTDAVVWQYGAPRHIATASRLPILFLGVLLGAVIFRWAREEAGIYAGLLALGLYASDPNCIAHGSLVTTDMAATFFSIATLYIVHRYCKNGKIPTLIGAGVLLGLAQLAKVSALMLLPVTGLLLLAAAYECYGTRWKTLSVTIAGTGIMVVVTLFVIWAGYGFEVIAVPGLPGRWPAGTHIRIYQSLQEHYKLGHPTFLMGKVGTQGWWWYFPLAFVLKTPTAALILTGGLILWIVAATLRNRANLESWVLQGLHLTVFPAAYAFAGLFSSVNIGYRHLLPLLPFLYIGMGKMVGRNPGATHLGKCNAPLGKCDAAGRSPGATHLRKCNAPMGNSSATHLGKCSAPVLILLLCWQGVEALSIAPDYVTFFNVFAGGATQGYHYLVDSNLDWGQNLWDLREWMADNGEEHVYYAHYSPARPQSYGIAADFLPPDPRAVAFSPWQPATGLYAIGATVLQGPYAPDINTFAWFRSHPPTAVLGNALWLYKVKERAPAVWAVVCAPEFATESLARYLGTTPERVIRPDCGQTWVYANTGGGAGLVVQPTSLQDNPPGTVPDVKLRSTDGEMTHIIYRVEADTPVGVPMPYNAVEIDGPLDFLGYQVTDGEDLVVSTYWQVKETTGRPLSLMAHLIGPGGEVIAVGDGLGYPVEQWQVEDVFIQRHRFERQPEGEYMVHTGGYWLDTMERWTVRDADGVESDHIVLEVSHDKTH